MAAQVFISHSCKDKEKKAPAGLTTEQAQLRAARLAFARTLRNQLFAKLKQDKRFKVFLDVRGGLKAGDVWRNGLHTALRTCSAGIVLLSPESLESRWVLKEATILSWRVFLGEPVVLIPVVLEVSQSQLEEHGFGALNLDDIQWVRVENSGAKSIAKAIKETVSVLNARVKKLGNPLLTGQDPRKSELWIYELATSLGKVIGPPEAPLGGQYLKSMCAALEIEPSDKKRFDADPLVNVASQVLVADDDQIVNFLQVAGAPDKVQREVLKDAVSALWVDPTPATRLLAGKTPVIAIDAREIASARDYLVRAFCTKVPWPRVVEPSDTSDGTDAAILQQIRDELAKYVAIDSLQNFKADLEKNGPVYVILGPGSTKPTVLDAVTRDYPGATFIVAAGPKPQEKLGAWYAKALLLRPLLQRDKREDAGFRYRNKLQKFVQGNSP